MPDSVPSQLPVPPRPGRVPGLSDALHLVATRVGDDAAIDRAFRLVAYAIDCAVEAFAHGAFARAPRDVVEDAAGNVAEQLVRGLRAPYRGCSDAEASAWIARVLRSRVVDLLKQGARVVPIDDAIEALPAPPWAWPDHDPEDDPDLEAGSLRDARRAAAHLDLVRAEIARAHPGAVDGLVAGLDLWLEARGARTTHDQLVAAFGLRGARATGIERSRLVNLVHKQRSRGRAEAIAAVVRLARARKVDDLVAASLFRLFGATLAERGRGAA